jgi:hypothetical protein
LCPSLLCVTIANKPRESESAGKELYVEYIRITESNHVCDIEDECEHNDGDEAAILGQRANQHSPKFDMLDLR